MRNMIRRWVVWLGCGLLLVAGLTLLYRVPTFLQEDLLVLWVLVLGLFLLILWRLPKWQVYFSELSLMERLEREDEARRTLAQILGGAVVLAGLYFSLENLRTTEKSLKVSQEGQITDRFTKAINQLGEKGNDKLLVRLGGIYALEQISEDPEAADKYHWPIMEVLTAYIREEGLRKEEAQATANKESSAKEKPKEKKQDAPKLPADIQAILTVIGRRSRTSEKEPQRLDLHDTNIHNAEIYRANLSGVHLDGADLRGAKNLMKAHFEWIIRDNQTQFPVALKLFVGPEHAG